MTTKKVTCVALLSVLFCEAQADESHSPSFIDDSKLTITSRNFYFNRDFRHGMSNGGGTNASKSVGDRNGYAEEWAQGFMANFSSGFTPGTVGLGFDAYSFLGIKLDSGGGRAGVRLTQLDSDGEPRDHFSKSGGAVKLRYGGGLLQYGNLFPSVPVLSVNTVRLFPSSATGGMLGWDIDKLHLDAAHFNGQGGVDSSNNDDDFTTDYGLPIAIKSVSYVGAKYSFGNALKASIYASEAKDTWKQYYANGNYTHAIDAGQSITFDANVYRTVDTGKKLASVIDNTTYSLSMAYKYKAHTFTLAYQKVDSDEPMDWLGFGTAPGVVSLANAIQFSTFTEPNERSFQLRYDIDMAAFGVPGLSFMTRYARGDDVSNHGSDNTFYTRRYVYPEGDDVRHWERDIEARYVVQSGPAKDLSIRVRQATHRGSTGYRYADNNEVRVIVDYPISIF
ncbi:OprD family porin [Pseudomonas sp. NPDC089395]|uniref:OprD family porin n=1 Tax=unclassified Pseudomonas TaxID=196821 RepID=UPI00300A4746